MKMSRLPILATAIFASMLGTAAHAACEIPAGMTKVNGQNVVLGFKTQPQPIKVGEMFKLELTLCPKLGQVISVGVDATMPQHKHGMNYKPTVHKANDTTFNVDGMMFHMPGRWQIAFDVLSGPGREQIRYTVNLR